MPSEWGVVSPWHHEALVNAMHYSTNPLKKACSKPGMVNLNLVRISSPKVIIWQFYWLHVDFHTISKRKQERQSNQQHICGYVEQTWIMLSMCGDRRVKPAMFALRSHGVRPACKWSVPCLEKGFLTSQYKHTDAKDVVLQREAWWDSDKDHKQEIMR